MVFSFGVVFANDEISVEIDGVKQSYDVMPVIVNGRTLVPLRAIFEALGADIVSKIQNFDIVEMIPS